MITLITALLPACSRSLNNPIYDARSISIRSPLSSSPLSPSVPRPTHSSQFFFTGNCFATLHTACPLMAAKIRTMPEESRIDCIAFPDEGACKRFGGFFSEEFKSAGIELVTCCKKRNVGAEGRTVEIFDGNPSGKNVLVMDDLIQTGGTMYEAAAKLKESGAKSVSSFVVHAVFPNEGWKRFTREGDRGAAFTKFWLTNSNPAVSSSLPVDDIFEVLDLTPQILLDL